MVNYSGDGTKGFSTNLCRGREKIVPVVLGTERSYVESFYITRRPNIPSGSVLFLKRTRTRRARTIFVSYCYDLPTNYVNH